MPVDGRRAEDARWALGASGVGPRSPGLPATGCGAVLEAAIETLATRPGPPCQPSSRPFDPSNPSLVGESTVESRAVETHGST